MESAWEKKQPLALGSFKASLQLPSKAVPHFIRRCACSIKPRLGGIAQQAVWATHLQEGRHHLYLSIHQRILLTVARPKHQNPVFNSANAGNGLNSVPPGFIGWAEAPTSAWPRVEMGSRRRQLKLNEVIRVGPLPTGLMSCRKRLQGTHSHP